MEGVGNGEEKIDEDKIHEQHYEQIHEQVKNDPYAQSLGIQLTKFEAGTARSNDRSASHMVNAYGKISLGLSTTIQFIESAKTGDKIVARATEIKRNYRTGFYRIDVFLEENLIATMEAVSYRKLDEQD
ncbi:hotdog domain-containing protein [Peribacillus simplex]|uniref:PaaI family thioesterase n=1 Tax=Peribacillus simplex TaxID=1478 RepID=UPI00285304A9|nr:hotdog domain-containing protein [Peribacillus simplex]MDR4924818.1 hotdog domain-containing protein [Peribacillus simplex]